ncbi:hypothetical protein [Nocardioides hwasunensis]|uniref:Asp23/Gls24 family envelope stress response protein n=1 Tax=Nocardioides hwasunensis TaxID=397258 RepID=A0ABR8M9Y8_9ACTN|nr:hypothetical protein [Nocardioides hwasunensis]MBD3912987.1 hypothetical protein [Nocardioides hwasunensis]
MTAPTGTARGDQPAEAADLVAAAVLAVPGVSGLHGGAFGEVGTYLPGRRVSGVRLGEQSAVHITVAMHAEILEVVREVRDTVSALVGGPVEVVVEDVTATEQG